MSATTVSPVVVTRGSTDPAAPLVVLLHGRGSDEQQIIGLADHLPEGPAYAAVRAPLAEGAGYAWFANRGIGRPVTESLAANLAWFRSWLDEVAPAGRPVLVAGFSGGAAFAGGLALADPGRLAGLGVLLGTLPFDAGLPVTPGRLAHLPTFVAQGEEDRVIPRELLDRTWTYLLGASGAPTVAHRDPGGHGLTVGTVHALSEWIAHRVHHLQARGAAPAGRPGEVAWPTLPGGRLPERAGERPAVSWTIPQQQLTQTAPVALQEQLLRRIRDLAGVAVAPSRISVPGARALILEDATGPDDAFLVPQVGEFAHLHPAYDGSLHLALAPDQAADVVARGWGVPHMWAGTRLTPGFVMVHGPRDAEELEVVVGIVTASHVAATRT